MVDYIILIKVSVTPYKRQRHSNIHLNHFNPFQKKIKRERSFLPSNIWGFQFFFPKKSWTFLDFAHTQNVTSLCWEPRRHPCSAFVRTMFCTSAAVFSWCPIKNGTSATQGAISSTSQGKPTKSSRISYQSSFFDVKMSVLRGIFHVYPMFIYFLKAICRGQSSLCAGCDIIPFFGQHMYLICT